MLEPCIFIWAKSHINFLQEKFFAQGIQMIVISVGEGKDTVQNYLERHHYSFDVLLDEDQTLEGPYRIIGVPTLFFVDEQGMIRNVDHALPENYEEVFK